MQELTTKDARRLAVRAQVLTARRPADLLDTVRRLGYLQHDPIAAVAPSADLVVWSRLGSEYDPEALTEAIDAQRVIELRGRYRPAEDIALYTAEMAAWPGVPGQVPQWQFDNARWVEANRGCRDDILALLRSDGPLAATELPDTCVRPWRSSGWNNRKNVHILLDLLVQSGQVAVAGRRGKEKLWDLAERVYPDDEPVPPEQAARLRDEQRLRALGIVRVARRAQQVEPLDVGEVGVEVVVEGVRGRWRIAAELLDEPFEPRTALLAPLDRLLFDRARMEQLFDFDYTLEMYKPAAVRRWGYYALPVLHGDALVGKVDAKAEHARGRLVVHAVHEDEAFTPAVRAAVDAEIEDLAQWLELRVERDRTTDAGGVSNETRGGP